MSVAKLAGRLAHRLGENKEKAELAGVLHDVAKEWPAARLRDAVVRHRLVVPGREFILRKKQYHLFHAHVSAWVAERDFEVKDKAVLSAIAKHTLGDFRMSRLDKILYVADFAAPDRPSDLTAPVLRLAPQDLDQAFRLALRFKLIHVLQRGAGLHPASVELWNQLAS